MVNPTILLNETGIIGKGIELATINITGSLFITLLCILLGVLMFFFMLRLPLELTALFILPLLILLAAYGGIGFVTILGLFLMYIALLLAGHFFLK